MKERTAAVVAGVTAASALAVLSCRGIYLRWFADDYWTAGVTATHGFWAGQVLWYRIWSGRYALWFVQSVLMSIGPRASIPLVTGTTIGMVAALRTRLRWPLALVMAYAILLCTSDVPQSLLWQTGLLSYTIPLAAFVWWLGNAASREELRWFDFVMPLASGGCSEIGVIAQIAVCAIAFAAWRRKPMLAALLASLVALAVIAAAPGNLSRKAAYPPMPPLLRVIEATVKDAGAFLANTFAGSGMAFLLVFLAAALFAPRISPRLAIVAVLSAVVCVFVTFAPAEVILLTTLPLRARIVPYAFLVAAVAAAGAIVPWQERWRRPIAAALIITSIAPLITAVQMAREIPQARTFAKRWDRLDAFLRTSRGRDVFVDHAPGVTGTLLFIAHDPANNLYMRDTYGLRSLAGMPPDHNGRLVIGPLPKDAVRYRFD
jgi:Family of unknown function (DUF6056)